MSHTREPLIHFSDLIQNRAAPKKDKSSYAGKSQMEVGIMILHK